MYLEQAIHLSENRFLSLCDLHKVKKMYAFGSSVRNDFDEKASDIDLMVEINERDPEKKGDLLLSLFDTLQRFFNRKVDLLTDQPIRNPYFKEAFEKSKVLIYDGESKEILV